MHKLAFKRSRWLAALVAITAPISASSQTLFTFEEVPTNWRLQVYVGEGPVIWYTPTSCNGRLEVAHMSPSEQDKLWALVLAAKLANHRVGIEYYVQGTGCFIRSYFIQQP